jgi:hypothetical protein
VLTKRTVIGIAVGSVIVAIGLYALVSSLGLQTIKVDETLDVGKSVTYGFTAPKSAHQQMTITGEQFHVKLETPPPGIQKDETFKNEIIFEWYMLQEGQNRIAIQNTGNTETRIMAEFTKNTDPILIAYHIMVITAGTIIIGFSAGFSVRKPKGF